MCHNEIMAPEVYFLHRSAIVLNHRHMFVVQ